jgi:hypothetical protein
VGSYLTLSHHFKGWPKLAGCITHDLLTSKCGIKTFIFSEILSSSKRGSNVSSCFIIHRRHISVKFGGIFNICNVMLCYTYIFQMSHNERSGQMDSLLRIEEGSGSHVSQRPAILIVVFRGFFSPSRKMSGQ